MIRLIVFIFSFLFSNVDSDQIIAKVGDKIISVQDFIERAEYTPRPFYCRGKSSTDKRIILNSLVGEKLFSIEMTKEVPTEIGNYLIGRRNQKMREVLFESITQNSFKKKNKFSHWKALSSLDYSFSYLSISNDYELNEVQNEISAGKSLDEIFYLKTKSRNIPKREKVNLFTVGNRALREELFSKVWNSGDIIGPIKTDDNLIMFVQIDGRHKIINMNQSAALQLNEEVDNLIVNHLQESDFDIYVKNLMSGLKFELNPNTYLDFTYSIKDWYTTASDIKNNDLKTKLYIENTDDVLLTLDNEQISIGEVLDWMAIHPLVFRDGYYKELHFSDQLKYALADLIKEAHMLVPKITCEELSGNKDALMLIDVRESSEIEETGSIDGAVNIPRGLIEMKLSPNDESMKPEMPIVVFCGGGSRAALAGATLLELGFKNVKNLDGGFRGWKNFSE